MYLIIVFISFIIWNTSSVDSLVLLKFVNPEFISLRLLIDFPLFLVSILFPLLRLLLSADTLLPLIS
uniref:Uncharacterized protein n=1 Tax=Schistosoma japonicum TaxID=6182 RepID=Q5BX50_SCHJA|nr:unknown [Schistosoma japonicum]